MSHAIYKSMSKTDEISAFPQLKPGAPTKCQCHNHHCTVQYVGWTFSSKNKPCAKWAGPLYPNFIGK